MTALRTAFVVKAIVMAITALVIITAMIRAHASDLTIRNINGCHSVIRHIGGREIGRIDCPNATRVWNEPDGYLQQQHQQPRWRWRPGHWEMVR